jgi:hypothetical protein
MTLSVSSEKTVSLEHLNPLAMRSLAAAAFRSSYPTRGQSMPRGEERGGEGEEGGGRGKRSEW